MAVENQGGQRSEQGNGWYQAYAQDLDDQLTYPDRLTVPPSELAISGIRRLRSGRRSMPDDKIEIENISSPGRLVRVNRENIMRCGRLFSTFCLTQLPD
ncbi:MAG: hypothetical protein ACK43M_19590 [Allorhizobium sp.]|uniref:hypothetical protein n=1 Tax=Aureimonas altamirensis TaxID=370622 RepID=UPI001FCD315A|nr:hypothetical protein [Aureimonas altamirensis]